MKKSDLRSGMVVETRSGKLYLVVGDFMTNDDGFFVLEHFENNLKSKSSFKYVDIVKVYERYNDIYENYAGSLKTLFDKKYLNLLWERKEESTLTDREKEMLKALKTLGLEWLSRDENGRLYAFVTKPEKYKDMWIDGGGDGYYFSIKENVLTLDFIKWEDKEPIKIDDLLKGEIK